MHDNMHAREKALVNHGGTVRYLLEPSHRLPGRVRTPLALTLALAHPGGAELSHAVARRRLLHGQPQLHRGFLICGPTARHGTARLCEPAVTLLLLLP